MRIKELNIDGAIYRIGSLAMGDVMKFAEEFDAATMDADKLKQRAYSIVAAGLNKALAEGEKVWNAARVEAELDLIEFKTLFAAIHKHSGIDLGEILEAANKAAVSTTSTASAPASV